VTLRAHAYFCSYEGLDVEPLPPDVRLRCDAAWPGAHSGRGGRCSKPATHGVRYVWGAAVYCKKHADEECRTTRASKT
jgi:hypothetical protein